MVALHEIVQTWKLEFEKCTDIGIITNINSKNKINKNTGLVPEIF